MRFNSSDLSFPRQTPHLFSQTVEGYGGVQEEREMVDQKVGGPAVEDHPLVKSLRAILKELDDQYEREGQNLIATLPNTNVKERALAMLKARHLQRRKNYSRELAALLEKRSVGSVPV
jgi:hypothetical protein